MKEVFNHFFLYSLQGFHFLWGRCCGPHAVACGDGWTHTRRTIANLNANLCVSYKGFQDFSKLW